MADGEGLYLRVRPTGKVWVYRYKLLGKEAKLSLGHYPVVTLAIGIIAPTEVVRCLHRIEACGNPETAQRVREAVQHVFQCAVDVVRGSEQEFSEHPNRRPVAAARPALRCQHRSPEAGAAAARHACLQRQRYHARSFSAFALAVPEACQLRLAHWEDVDLEQALWRCPPEKMKLATAPLDVFSLQAEDRLRSLDAMCGRYATETGAFWSSAIGQRIDRRHRVDRALLDEINALEDRLTSLPPANGQPLPDGKQETQASRDFAQRLIGRCIFTSYLVDRGIAQPFLPQALPADVAGMFGTVDATFTLFRWLRSTFNGDLFPMDDPGAEHQRLISTLPLKHLEAVPAAYDKVVAVHLTAKVERVTDFIRRRLRSPALKAATDNFSRGPRDNFRSLMDGIDWIAQRHRFVVSLRIDLHWDAQSREPLMLGQYPDYTVVDPFMQARVKFQRYLQRKFGDELLGVTWTFEHGQRSRFHAHYWILIKPAACADPLAMVDELGEHWKGITGGDGRGFFNCHTIRHKHRAIGRVDLHDETVIVGVRRLSTYFTAAGLHVKLDLGGKHNTFGMTGFPKGPVNKPGPKPKTVPPVLRIPMHIACDQYIGWI